MEVVTTDLSAARKGYEKVLITGGAGFIGSHIADRLVGKCEVVLADNLVTGRRDNVTSRARFFEVDICSHEFHAVFENYAPDLVIHCAASYKDPNDHWSDARTNVLGSVQVARLSKQCGVKRIVYFQTALCYGLTPASPVPTDHELSPWDTSYALSKTAGERYLMLSGVPLTVFRLAHICGPRNVSGPIPTFYKRISEGLPCKITDSRRDFVYVDDLVDLVEKVADRKCPEPLHPQAQVYHVSGGRDWPILALYNMVAQAMGNKFGEHEFLPGGLDDAKTILLNNDQTRLDFKWAPKTPLKEAIAEAVKWYQAHGVGETYTHLRAAK